MKFGNNHNLCNFITHILFISLLIIKGKSIPSNSVVECVPIELPSSQRDIILHKKSQRLFFTTTTKIVFQIFLIN